MASTTATLAGKTSAAAYNTNTLIPDVSHPASGQRLTMFLKYSAGTSAIFQNGSLVKNINAAKARSTIPPKSIS